MQYWNLAANMAIVLFYVAYLFDYMGRSVRGIFSGSLASVS